MDVPRMDGSLAGLLACSSFLCSPESAAKSQLTNCPRVSRQMPFFGSGKNRGEGEDLSKAGRRAKKEK